MHIVFIYSFRIFLLCLFKYTRGLLLRGAPDYSIDTVSGLVAKALQTTEGEELAHSKGPNVAVRAGQRAPNLPLSHHAPGLYILCNVYMYCIVSIHLYCASCSAHQSEALPVRETQ